MSFALEHPYHLRKLRLICFSSGRLVKSIVIACVFQHICMAEQLKQGVSNNTNARTDKKEEYQECPECGLSPLWLMGLEHGECRLPPFGQVT